MNILTQVVLPLSLVFIMFSMGITLTKADFTNIKKYPKAFCIGFLLQVVSLPLVAFIMAKIGIMSGHLTPEIAMGLIIIAACPGGVTSNLMVHMGRGNTALSISLTTVISILSVITIPIIINMSYLFLLGDQNTYDLPIYKTVLGILVITLIPIILGMILLDKKPELAKKITPISAKISAWLFALICLAIYIKEWKLLVEHFNTIAPYTFIFNILILLIAFLTSKAFSIEARDRIALIFECGFQNGTLALMIAFTFLQNEVMGLPAGIYSIFMFTTGGLYLFYLMRKSKSLA